MNHEHKDSFLREVINVLITTLIGTLLTFLTTIFLQWATEESVVIDLSTSVFKDESFVTILSAQNLEDSTLSELSLYIDKEVTIQNVESSDAFAVDNQYIRLEEISPNQQYSAVIITDLPLKKEHLTAESSFKTRISVDKTNESQLRQLLWYMIPLAIFIFSGTTVQIWIDWKKRNEIHKRLVAEIDRIDRESKEKEKDISNKQEKIVALNKEIREEQEVNGKEIKELKKSQREIRLYYSARVSDLRKELSFWKDTIRKIIYNGQNELQTPECILDMVTYSLKTYTTKESCNDNFDEIMYLAERISNHSDKDKENKG